MGPTLSINDSTTSVTNRLGDEPVTINGGTFTYTPNTAGSSRDGGRAESRSSGVSTINISSGGKLYPDLCQLGPSPASSELIEDVAASRLGSNETRFSLRPLLPSPRRFSRR